MRLRQEEPDKFAAPALAALVKSTAAVGKPPVHHSSHPTTLIAIIVILVLLLLGSALGYFLIRRYFEKKRRQQAPVRTVTTDRAAGPEPGGHGSIIAGGLGKERASMEVIELRD
ncbi:hypothetical protein F4780DRAFT_778603 [Xylariomycetidae sp. FL0641]|nr:hypothetical protein F4780DRAFT_778603 [Xylariomycetidae sp. FL0641]